MPYAIWLTPMGVGPHNADERLMVSNFHIVPNYGPNAIYRFVALGELRDCYRQVSSLLRRANALKPMNTHGPDQTYTEYARCELSKIASDFRKSDDLLKDIDCEALAQARWRILGDFQTAYLLLSKHSVAVRIHQCARELELILTLLEALGKEQTNPEV